MGSIPAQAKTVSGVITFPQNGDDIDALTTFNMSATISNIQLGSFTNATVTYYAAPQQLNGQGLVIGHMVIQSTGNSLNPTQPLDGTKFAFFKGINDAGNGQGSISTPVTGGLPKGNYRACTMTSASNHQPVLMAIAQRGPQDDCVRFTVGGGVGQGAGNNQAGGSNQAGGKNQAGGQNQAGGSNAGNSTSTQTGANNQAGGKKAGIVQAGGKKAGNDQAGGSNAGNSTSTQTGANNQAGNNQAGANTAGSTQTAAKKAGSIQTGVSKAGSTQTAAKKAGITQTGANKAGNTQAVAKA